ncbi:Histone H1 [Spatholobus suberectus]|nr:Histone H1 [Spatholobus suberectus]
MAKANAKNKSPPTALHPPYFEMIADAISALKERTGSSQPAIAKFIEDKHAKVLPPNFRKLLSVQLKKLVKSEKLYKVKNSYKLSSSEKTETAAKQKKVGEKTKRLSQVNTPEALKKKAPNKRDAAKKKSVAVTASGTKVKRLSQVKTPEALKKKKPNLTPMKRKTTSKPVNPSRPNKRARK